MTVYVDATPEDAVGILSTKKVLAEEHCPPQSPSHPYVYMLSREELTLWLCTGLCSKLRWDHNIELMEIVARNIGRSELLESLAVKPNPWN